MVKMGYVWDRTVEFLGDNLSLIVPIVIVGLFVPASITGSLDGLRQSGGPGLRLTFGILSLVFAILSLWVQLAIAALAIDPAIGPRMKSVATARLLPAIGITLLLIVGMLLLCVPIGIVLAMGGFDMAAVQAGQAPTVAPGYGLIAVVYVLLLAVVLIVAGARLMPLGGVIVAERRGLGAIGRAFRLTRGLTWRLIGVILLYAVVALVSILAVQTVFGSVLRIVAGGDGAISIAGVVTAIAVAAVSAGFSTLAAAFAAKLYVAIQRTLEPAVAPVGEGMPDHS